MDKRYKAVTLRREDYEKLRKLAKKNKRTLSGQMAHLLEWHVFTSVK